jgi:hypothetical protein
VLCPEKDFYKTMNTDTENATRLIEIVTRETANASGISTESIHNKQCQDKYLATVVGILDDMGIESLTIGAHFGEDTAWVHGLKVLAHSEKETSMYQQAKINSDSALMTESLGGADLAQAIEASNQPAPVRVTNPQKAEDSTPRKLERIPSDPICASILDESMEYYGIDEADILNPTKEDDLDAQSKCVKAMKMAGAATEHIREAFNAPDDAWVDAHCAKVDDEDGDVEMIIRGAKEKASKDNNPSQTEPSSEKQDLVSKIARILGIDKDTLINGTGHSTSRKRSRTALIMKARGVEVGDIAQVFGRTKGWYYFVSSKASTEDRTEVARVMRLLGPTDAGDISLPEPKRPATPSPAPALVPRAQAPAVDLTVATRPEHNAVELQEEELPPDATLEQISERVFAALVPASILLAPDPAAALMIAKQALVFIACGNMSAAQISASTGIPEETVFGMIGKMFCLMQADPRLAKKIKAIRRG